MKKLSSVTMLILVFAACFCLAFACGDEEISGKRQYAVTVESGEGFTLSADKTAAEFGETVTVTVILTDKDSYVTEVFANGDSSFVYENPDGTYSTMITEDTVITAGIAPYVETRKDGVAAYTGTDFILKNATMPLYNEENVWDLTLSVDHGRVWSLSRLSYAVSSDQSVIPQEAIGELVPVPHSALVGSSGTSAVAQVIVPVDTTRISEGTAWLIVYLRADAGASGADGKICVRITVAETMALPGVSAVVEIDLEGYASEGEDVSIRFFDEDFLESTTLNGEPAAAFTDVTAKVDADGKASFAFDCVAGHRYRIHISLGTEYVSAGADPAKVLVPAATEVVSGGSSLTGYNQYTDGCLSFAVSGSITLSVRGTFAEVYG